jgi:ABC-type glutathione transport system ATPase component
VIWRNIGIVIAFWVFFTAMACLGAEVNTHRDQGSQVLFDERATKRDLARQGDIEARVSDKAGLPEPSGSDTEGDGSPASSNQATFTFKDISYFVHHQGAEKQLLRQVSGFVKPGQLVALMGSSGAGKTTLMDALAQRKDEGRIEGSIMVNGRPQGISFQRTTGYCEQNDVHEPTATVWESLVFSARLRQRRDIPDADKLEYVRSIIELLELTPLQHALVGGTIPLTPYHLLFLLF